MQSCQITNQQADTLLQQWKVFPNAAILVPLGPGNGSVTITHTMPGPKMSINGLVSNSPLANNALYSAECAADAQGNLHYLNLYEVMLPDIPGVAGQLSTGSIYVNALENAGLDVAGVHFHWWGSTIVPQDKGVVAVHHQKVDMPPAEFSRRTIAALQLAMQEISRRSGNMPMPPNMPGGQPGRGGAPLQPQCQNTGGWNRSWNGGNYSWGGRNNFYPLANQPNVGQPNMGANRPNQGNMGQPGGQPNQGNMGQPGGQPNQGNMGQPGGQPNQGNMGQPGGQPNQGRAPLRQQRQGWPNWYDERDWRNRGNDYWRRKKDRRYRRASQ
jgi:hypothetical protein